MDNVIWRGLRVVTAGIVTTLETVCRLHGKMIKQCHAQHKTIFYNIWICSHIAVKAIIVWRDGIFLFFLHLIQYLSIYLLFIRLVAPYILISLGKHEYLFASSIITYHWDGTGSWNLSSWSTGAVLPHILYYGYVTSCSTDILQPPSFGCLFECVCSWTRAITAREL